LVFRTTFVEAQFGFASFRADSTVKTKHDFKVEGGSNGEEKQEDIL